MIEAKKVFPIRYLKSKSVPIILSVILLILAAFTYQVIMSDKYHPFTFVGDTNISFLTKGQAIRTVQSTFQKRAEQKLTFNSPSSSESAFTIDLATSSAALDFTVLGENFKDSHQNPLTFFTASTILPKITLSLNKQLESISAALHQEPENAQLIFDETPNPEGTPSARIQIKEAKEGITLNKKAAEEEVINFLLTGKYQPILSLETIPPKVSTDRVVAAKEALENVLKAPIKLTFNQQAWFLDAKQLLTLLDLTKGEDLLLDKDQTASFLKNITQEIDQPVQEGLFEFNPASKRVTAFKPSKEGRRLDVDKTYLELSDALISSRSASINIALPVEIVKLKIETADVNSLGIKELLGRGISNFAGSISNRIYNIGLTASKINGVLIPPGEVFSFNQTVGDISAATGFKQAYVIKEGRTVLDDGGGVCQDSTTLFRAVLNAGLPVVKRTAHAYRVSYYEQGFPPGLDATVFYPSVDFQFKNDTQNHILIQAYTSGLTLYVDLYGTSDGRVVNMTNPIVTGQTPPPPELRQDDPTLPKGTVKQVDWSAWGAIVTFKRTVTRNGETLASETWKSAYKPWQAVYLVGTQ